LVESARRQRFQDVTAPRLSLRAPPNVSGNFASEGIHLPCPAATPGGRRQRKGAALPTSWLPCSFALAATSRTNLHICVFFCTIAVNGYWSWAVPVILCS